MALNRVYAQSNKKLNAISVGSALLSGAPTVIGQIPGVLLSDAEATTFLAVVQLDGIFNLSVKGVNAGGNIAIAVGDILYFTVADTPKVNAKVASPRFGYALAAITSGSTATIPVQIGY